MERFALVCLAGALGSGARYLVGLWAQDRFGPQFPFGTLMVNVAGCFLIGLIMTLAEGLPGFPLNLRYTLVTGFLGGLTTYSAFNWETTKLFSTAPATGALYFGSTLGSCLIAGLVGMVLARRFL